MIITRFAPSPTGHLHIGGARTALFAWLWAKKNHGKYILRVEDTDQTRSTQASVQGILEGLTWLGLAWDEGPYYQTERFARYHAAIQQLIAGDHAYKCYCTKARLTLLREKQLEAKEKPRYDGYCLRYPPAHLNLPYVVRFKTPKTGSIVFNDLVRGRIEIKNEELDDLIIARTDGTPTYNLTVVIDDWDMGVTHVLRGDDHINNTPRQIHILQAFNAKVPEYGHMPMLLGADGKRLSKRHGAVSVLEYQKEGILPKALLNYLVRLGWAYKDQEIFSVEEMLHLFDVHAIQRAPTALNPDKLLWLNQHYLKTEPPDTIAKMLEPHLLALGVNIEGGADLKEVVCALRERSKTLVEMAQKSQFFYLEEIVLPESLVTKHFTQEICVALATLIQNLEQLSEWKKEVIQSTIASLSEALGIKLGLIAQPIRVAVTGMTASPSIEVTLYLLGKEKTLRRLKEALSQAKELLDSQEV